MVDIVELQFATMLSNRLEHFKIKSTNPYKINFRCPVCGDSKKSRSKARGWLLEDAKDQSLHFFCHNCGASQGFGNFLKTIDPLIYNDFITSKYIDKAKHLPGSTAPVVSDDSFKTNTAKQLSDPLKKIKKISQLRHDHPVKKYIVGRQIPPNQHYRLYYAPKFQEWINSILPGKLPSTKADHPRLILPFMDENGKCFGVSGRGFDPEGLRYITIMFDDKPKVFGLDKVDFDKPYKIVEGPIDSLFLNNAMAMAGADGNFDGIKNTKNATFVFDNEPRNKEIHKRMDKLIRDGMAVCIWPASIAQKDVNDMVLAGLQNIDKIIKDNTYRGLEANLKLSMWRKT
jgi:transcription elongation factor Elf1